MLNLFQVFSPIFLVGPSNLIKLVLKCKQIELDLLIVYLRTIVTLFKSFENLFRRFYFVIEYKQPAKGTGKRFFIKLSLKIFDAYVTDGMLIVANLHWPFSKNMKLLVANAAHVVAISLSESTATDSSQNFEPFDLINLINFAVD